MRTTSCLLVGKIGVVYCGHGCVVRSVQQHSSEFGSGGFDTSGKDQRGASQVDEGDHAAGFNSPTPPENGWQARLPPVGNLGGRDLCVHALHCNSLAFTRRRPTDLRWAAMTEKQVR